MPSCVTHINTNLQKYKNSVVIVQKIDLIQKLLNHFSKLPDKKPFVGPFLSPKNLNLTLLFLKVYTQVLLVCTFAEHAKVILMFHQK